jgi:Dipeptidyl peptidase IV (DPP IV) N-terminal region
MRGSRFLLGIVVASVVVGPQAAPSLAVFRGASGLIAFTDNDDIYTIAPDGSPPLSRLTFDGQSRNPRWSPTGDRIAFDRAGDIYVMSAAGGNVRRLTMFGGSSQPAWAPAGKRLVFVHRRAGAVAGDLWTVPVSGGTPTRLTFQSRTSCELSHPTWSPLGGRIAYARSPLDASGACTQPTQVEVMRIEPRARTIIPWASEPDFTADGRGLFFASRLDPQGEFLLTDQNLTWSNLVGDHRELLTFFDCIEGDPCFIEGVGAPDSAFPGVPSFAYAESHLGGPNCLRTSSGDGVCSDRIGVTTFQMDWQALPSG